MGHKISPRSFRTGVIYGWDSRWFERRPLEFARLLREDVELRTFLLRRLKDAAVASVHIERSGAEAVVIISSAKPGVIIGRGGAGIEDLKKELAQKFFKKGKIAVKVNIEEVRKPGLSASITAQGIVADIEKRMSFRRVMRQTMERVSRAGAQGVKVRLSGRLDGAEIARTESLASGKIPLHNLRADIDYSYHVAHTIYGTIGVKVWIYRGEVFEKASE